MDNIPQMLSISIKYMKITQIISLIPCSMDRGSCVCACSTRSVENTEITHYLKVYLGKVKVRVPRCLSLHISRKQLGSDTMAHIKQQGSALHYRHTHTHQCQSGQSKHRAQKAQTDLGKQDIPAAGCYRFLTAANRRPREWEQPGVPTGNTLLLYISNTSTHTYRTWCRIPWPCPHRSTPCTGHRQTCKFATLSGKMTHPGCESGKRLAKPQCSATVYWWKRCKIILTSNTELISTDWPKKKHITRTQVLT